MKKKTNNKETSKKLKPTTIVSPSPNTDQDQINLETQSGNVDVCKICKEREVRNNHHVGIDKKDREKRNIHLENLDKKELKIYKKLEKIALKENPKEPRFYICCSCHSKIHKTEPNLSELRIVVQNYRMTQKLRIQIDNSKRGYTYLEQITPEWYKEFIQELNKQETIYSKQIKNILEPKKTIKGMKTKLKLSKKGSKGKDHLNLENHFHNVFPIYSWLKKRKGMGHLLPAQLIAYIDINKSPTVASLRHHCGMHVVNGKAPRKRKGNKIDYTPVLRMICYKIAKSFWMQRTPIYRPIMEKEKEKQDKLYNDALKQMSNEDKKKFNKLGFKKGEEDKKRKIMDKYNEIAPLSLKHAFNRAFRKGVKRFLKDLWLAWRKIEKLPITDPYIQETKVRMKPTSTLSPDKTSKQMKTTEGLSKKEGGHNSDENHGAIASPPKRLGHVGKIKN